MSHTNFFAVGLLVCLAACGGGLPAVGVSDAVTVAPETNGYRVSVTVQLIGDGTWDVHPYALLTPGGASQIPLDFDRTLASSEVDIQSGTYVLTGLMAAAVLPQVSAGDATVAARILFSPGALNLVTVDSPVTPVHLKR